MAKRSWEIFEDACYSCKKCPLWETRTHVVIGKGTGGKRLDKMLVAIGLTLDDVYITNNVKCRRPRIVTSRVYIFIEKGVR